MTHPVVAVVLPPREIFSPLATGAVGLLARRLARAPSDFSPVVMGLPGAAPFGDVPFRAVRPTWRLTSYAIRYAAGAARLVAEARPALAEVHNRPEVALYLAKRFPSLPVVLVLHNDPQGMRRARTGAERRGLLDRLAAVVTVSGWLQSRFLTGTEAPSPLAGEGWGEGSSGMGSIAGQTPHPTRSRKGRGLLTVLPNCIDVSEIPPSPPERERTILFAGRVVADKGADSFVRACALALPQLPGWRAEVLGADRFGPYSPDTPFLRTLRPEAAAGGVALTGWRAHPEILTAMARAAIVVVPSRWPEPFGLTALEAMACGAALLCSARGGLPEVTGDAAVAIDPDDPAAMADAIVALARDPARRAALRAAGRARAEKFDVSVAADALDALRRDVLAAWPRRTGNPI